jgi:hypothetical protein
MSHAPVEGPGDLTSLQVRYLRNRRGFCDRPPTLGRIYRGVWKMTLWFVGLGLIGVWAIFDPKLSVMGWALVGFVVGVLLRDLGHFRMTVQLWPATAAVLDQRKLDELLGELPPDADW